jgi:polysaccharide pyruvyl transferase WcaK-like protein
VNTTEPGSAKQRCEELRGWGKRVKIAVITQLNDGNAGNEALSFCLLRFLREGCPEAEIRTIDRTSSLTRTVSFATASRLRRRPEHALAKFDAMVARVVRIGAHVSGVSLMPEADPSAVVPPPASSPRHPLLARLQTMIGLRSRLASIGLYGRHELEKTLATLAWADVVVWNPAGEFVPTAQWDGVLQLMLLAAAAERLGARVVVVNQSPQTADPLLDRLIAHVYSRFSLVFVRGQRSLAKALAIGIEPSKVIEAPDLVFALASRAKERPVSSGAALGPEGAIVLAINGPAASTGVDEWGSLLTELRRVGLPMIAVGNYVVEDSAFLGAYAGPQGIPRIVRQPGFRELTAFIASSAVVVSSRLHSAIFAVTEGVPVVAIEPGQFKMGEVLQQLGYPIPAQTIAEAGWSLQVLENVKRALHSRQEIVAAGNQGVRQQVAAIERAYQPLLTLLNSGMLPPGDEPRR